MRDLPLILFTNDDGIQSPGLWAAVEAFNDSAELLIVAPNEQQSASSRSMNWKYFGGIKSYTSPSNLKNCSAFSVKGTPAQAVQLAVIKLAERKPDLVISGINYGDNTGNVVTISGTVGAAIEAHSLGIPAIAVSQQTRNGLYSVSYDEVDFSIASYVTHYLSTQIIEQLKMPTAVDVLKIDVPIYATKETIWRFTRLSKHRIYWPSLSEHGDSSDKTRIEYTQQFDPAKTEPDSDVYAVLHDSVVAITPLNLDMTAKVDLSTLEKKFR